MLAHKFLNYFLDFQHSMDNFSWNGYQPPQTQADISALTSTEGRYSKVSNWAPPITYVPKWMPDAVVQREWFGERAVSSARAHARGRRQVAHRLGRVQGRVSEAAAPVSEPTRRQRRQAARALARSGGAWYPRWFWPSFAAPGTLWLVIFFILPFYTIIAVAFGTIDIFRKPVPVWQPWFWSTKYVSSVWDSSTAPTRSCGRRSCGRSCTWRSRAPSAW